MADLLARTTRPKVIEATAYEVDETVVPYLRETLELSAAAARACGVSFAFDIRQTDFVRAAVEHRDGLFSQPERYDWAILNPPYRKLAATSAERQMLRAVPLSVVLPEGDDPVLFVRLMRPRWKWRARWAGSRLPWSRSG